MTKATTTMPIAKPHRQSYVPIVALGTSLARFFSNHITAAARGSR